MLTVNSNTSWTVENETDWCKVDKTAGVNTENLVVSVDSNNTGAARSTVLHLVSELHNVDVTVNQDVSMEEYFYKLPVVFHIIYDQDHDTPTDTVQNIKAETIAALAKGCMPYTAKVTTVPTWDWNWYLSRKTRTAMSCRRLA